MNNLNLLRNVLVVKFICMFTLLLVIPACSVAPWERGNLAKRQMLISPNPTHSALRAHVFESKEASSGGLGAGGGGCGCN